MESGHAEGKHFAGTCTRMVLVTVAAKGGDGAVAEVLRQAGETRPVEDLYDESGWSSYGQLRALAEAAAVVLGDQRCFDDLYEYTGLFDTTMPGAAEMLQALGSPDALHRAAGETNGIMKVVSSVGLVHALGPNETEIGTRFIDGFEAFPEFCSLAMGLMGCTVKIFGQQITLLEDSKCVFHGDDHCAVRIRWADADEETETERLRLQLALVERRLDAFRETVADLVSDEDLETILQRTVTSAAGAMRAPGFVLALEPLPWRATRVFAYGLDEQAAADHADSLLDPDRHGEPDAAVVSVAEVASTKRRYGYLAAIDPHGNVAGYDVPVLGAYARLAASALDSATALEDSRRQAASARALLELSAVLAEVTSVDQMAENVARTTPIVVDCDTAMVVLVEDDVARVKGTHGYHCPEDEVMRATEFRMHETEGEQLREGIGVYTCHDAAPHIRARMEATGMAAGAAVPIRVNAAVAGWVVVGVRTNPERLVDNPEVEEQLRGLAGQVSTALRNAQLLEQVRHQALHDGLTGLPNRRLIVDRAEHLLSRVPRHGTSVAVLFIDLDGFKTVNDTLGHAAGDELLQAVAARLQATLRESDTIARFGGDEFIVLSESTATGTGPDLVAQRIIDVLREPFQLRGTPEPVIVGSSIGIAVGDRTTADELLRDADVALYEAKAAGKGRYVMFAPEMHAALADRLARENGAVPERRPNVDVAG